jgi:hypothetical protein
LRGARVLVVRSVVLGSGPLRKNGLDDILAHKEEEHLQPSLHGAILKQPHSPTIFLMPHVKAPQIEYCDTKQNPIDISPKVLTVVVKPIDASEVAK